MLPSSSGAVVLGGTSGTEIPSAPSAVLFVNSSPLAVLAIVPCPWACKVRSFAVSVIVAVVENPGISVVVEYVVDTASLNILATVSSVNARDLCLFAAAAVVVDSSSVVSIVMASVDISTSLSVIAAISSFE